MTFRALRLTAALGGDALERCELGPDLRQALVGAREEPGPVVLVICDDDFGRLDSCRELIVDRGRKHRAKALGPRLLGQEKIPLIRGGYTSPGQLIRSLRALFGRALSERDGNLFLIGADAAAFGELWSRASEAAGDVRTSPPPPPPAGTATAGSGGSLFALLPELPVPDSVRERFVGDSDEARLVLQLIVRAARQEQPVLILGDTGTGKEVVARLIHDQSSRRLQSFTAVNCGAIPRELLESELFGYEKGAHSTATARKFGLWQRAHGGTLFLDEIADLSLDHQVKIFRALEHGEVRPVGAEQELKVDARVIAATNRDLFAMMQAGEFRDDLYYRLRAFMIRTPALRDHPGDLPGLASHFWKSVTHDPAAELPEDIIADLAHYRWPGNARELRMVLSTLFALFGAHGLGVRHLHAVFEFEGQAGERSPRDSRGELALYRVECLRQLRRTDETLRAAKVALRPLLSGQSASPAEWASAAGVLEHRVNEIELLCRRPLLFHGEATFASVRTVKDRLRTLIELLRFDAGKALALWTRELERDFEEAVRTIFKEVETLLVAAAREG